MFCVFFFFQAEDGIRYYKVTGVQTCALPISAEGRGGPREVRDAPGRGGAPDARARRAAGRAREHPLPARRDGERRRVRARSEERRVGKEGRSRGRKNQ